MNYDLEYVYTWHCEGEEKNAGIKRALDVQVGGVIERSNYNHTKKKWEK